MAVQVGTQPGAGLEQAGRALAQIDPYKAEKEDMAQKIGQSQVERARAEASNAKFQTAHNEYTLRVIADHPGWLPPRSRRISAAPAPPAKARPTAWEASTTSIPI